MSIKQVVILAAGNSSRLLPFTQTCHKSELVVAGKPLIIRTLKALKPHNLKEVIVIVNQDNHTLPVLLKQYSYPFTVTVVRNPCPRGMGDALIKAQDYLDNHFVLLSPTHFQADTTLTLFKEHPETDVSIYYQPTETPHLFGCVTVENNLAKSLIEKPAHPPSNAQKLVGVYGLSQVFIKYMASLPTHEYVLETALDGWMQTHPVPAYSILSPTCSLRYPWDLLAVKTHLLTSVKPRISRKAMLAPTAIIRGTVTIETGALVGDYAIIEGPAYIGKNTVVGQHCIIRKGTCLEAGAQVQRFGDIANSIVMENTHIHSGFIGDTVIGANCRIGAGFITANRRFDRKEISVEVKSEKVNSKHTSLGAFIGHNVKIGIHCGTLPGTVIVNHSVIKPGTIV